jgi:glyoxylase-like metal-dependent hydrolase (beta-lactamase superfamily II)
MIVFKKINDWVTMAESDKVDKFKCNGLIIQTGKQSILIDCNFDKDEIGEIIEYAKTPINAYFATHMHIDHVNNLGVIEDLGIKTYAPCPENEYLKDLNLFLEKSGTIEKGVDKELKKLFLNYGFRELKKVLPFQPETFILYDSISIETIHLPGHSDGHSGFLIKNRRSNDPGVLFLSDLGLDSFGAWYGFNNSSVSDYKKSIKKVRKICESEKLIIASSHEDPVFDIKILDEILMGIEKTEKILIKQLDSNSVTTLDNLLLNGLFYKKSSMDKMNPFLRKLYSFWEYFILKNQLKDLELRGKAKELSLDEWVLT